MAIGASAIVSIAGLVVFGTFTSLAAKIVYELDGTGLDGKLKNFEKPWAMTTVMFVGMTFCIPIAYFNEIRAVLTARFSWGSASPVEEPLLASDGPISITKAGSTWKEISMLSIPTLFDLIATVLMNVGLLSVTASVYQMLRGAEMLFAALFAVLFLKRKLNKYHYSGIACCIGGITLVGISSILAREGSASHDVAPSRILFGMLLIVASQAVQAAQITFEDFFMADLDIPPLKIVGYEGLYGAVAMVCVLLPIVQRMPGKDGQGIHEDSWDTLHIIRSNPLIARILILDMGALLAYNVAGMLVTGHLGGVFRTVLETTRTLFVWLVDLVLFYTPLGMGKLGESWSGYSWVQAAGFVVLVVGTVVYGRGDEAAVVEEIDRGTYDAEAVGDTADGEALGRRREEARTEESTGAVAIPGRPKASPIRMAGSIRGSMTINAFGSLPSSVPRSLRARLLSPPESRGMIPHDG